MVFLKVISIGGEEIQPKITRIVNGIFRESITKRMIKINASGAILDGVPQRTVSNDEPMEIARPFSDNTFCWMVLLIDASTSIP